MHCRNTLQFLPGVSVVSIVAIEALAVIEVAGFAFIVIDAIAILGNVVVVMATDAAGLAFAGEGRGVVEQEETTAGLYVVKHRVDNGCREKTQSGVLL